METKANYTADFERARLELARKLEQTAPLHNVRVTLRQALDYVRQQQPSGYQKSVIRALEAALNETEQGTHSNADAGTSAS